MADKWDTLREWGWTYYEGCDCHDCTEWALALTGGQPPTTETEKFFEGEQWTPEEQARLRGTPKETIEQRNERIWQAIRGAAGG